MPQMFLIAYYVLGLVPATGKPRPAQPETAPASLEEQSAAVAGKAGIWADSSEWGGTGAIITKTRIFYSTPPWCVRVSWSCASPWA